MRAFFLIPIIAGLFVGKQSYTAASAGNTQIFRAETAAASTSSNRLHVMTFGPELAHKSFSTSIPLSSLSSSSSAFNANNDNPVAIALNYVHSLDLPNASYVIKNSYTADHNGVTHVYLRQLHNGLEILNGDINVSVDKNGHILSFGDSFYKGNLAASSSSSAFAISNTLSISDAFAVFASHIGKADSFASNFHGISIQEETPATSTTSSSPTKRTAKILNVPFALAPITIESAYLQTDDGRLDFGWRLTCEMEENWFDAFVSSNEKKVSQLIDWVADASYTVIPFGFNDPRDAAPVKVINPAIEAASPLGWHDRGNAGGKRTDTSGNNVFAQNNHRNSGNSDNLPRPTGGDTLDFNFPIDFTKEPETYMDGSVTNLFYLNNMIHDIFYQYGFNEKAGNFQQDNQDRGGLGKDAVRANAQDGSGNNNANFATPPDGQPGKMRMYKWTLSQPHRDGDFDAMIVTHEAGHGISTRMTGGPANSGCLPFGEAGGMGEGWGDFWGTIFRIKRGDTRNKEFLSGDYCTNDNRGVRLYPYTSDMKRNPETYTYIKKSGYSGVHAKGEVWAIILWEVFWNVVDVHGFDPNWSNPKAGAGNHVVLQNVVDALALQPCRPNFVNARDAILAADETNYEGKYSCLMWKGFAKRGLGKSASEGGNEAFDIPAKCQSDIPRAVMTGA